MATSTTKNKNAGGKADTSQPSEGDVKQWTVVATCENISPLLCDAMSDEMVWSVLHKGERPAKDRTSTKEEIAGKKLYKDPETGKLGIPPEMLFACLRGAGRKIKVGRGALSTATTTQLPSFLTIEDTFMPFLEENPSWIPDVRRGMMKNGSSSVACAIVRPKFGHWSFKVRIGVDLDGVDGLTLGHVQQLFQKAGSAQGLGSFRPSCNGPFGRFRVAGWEVKPSQ